LSIIIEGQIALDEKVAVIKRLKNGSRTNKKVLE
jgi:hypothetical protein